MSPVPSQPQSNLSWLLLECHACGRHLKLRPENLTSTLQCPTCKAALAVAPEHLPPQSPAARDMRLAGGASGTGSEGLPFREGAAAGGFITEQNTDLSQGPATQDPVAARQMLRETNFRRTDDPTVAIPSEGIRVRKRKRIKDSRSRAEHEAKSIEKAMPDWETDPNVEPTPISEESGTHSEADGWRQITSATVQVYTDQTGRKVEVKKRFKKKRKVEGGAKWFSFAASRMGATLFWLAVLLSSGGLGYFYYMKSKGAPPPPAPLPRTDITTVEDPYYPLKIEAAAAIAKVREFVQAPTVAEKVKHVRFQKRVRPMMEEWYRTRSLRDISDVRALPEFELNADLESLSKRLSVEGARVVILPLELLPSHETKIFALEERADGWRVDWETSVGWQPMSLTELENQRPTEPVTLRVLLNKSSYYNYAFSDSNAWASVQMSHPGDSSFSLYGYMDRKDPALQPMIDRVYGPTQTTDSTEGDVPGGEAVSVQASIAYPSSRAHPRQVQIVKIISDQWFDADPEAPHPDFKPKEAEVPSFLAPEDDRVEKPELEKL